MISPTINFADFGACGVLMLIFSKRLGGLEARRLEG